ncbi:hypothetical protein GCM10017774_29270 [Lentzea cavernae]|uniref:Uncharacterized protein n=1 Tax=Lentzea cavernae TaxID=2020703 RepID=A0ABQ3MBQ7_9PSEU|nr:hypothetical protein GCM10017774_29270 [Lentzea cavernae]
MAVRDAGVELRLPLEPGFDEVREDHQRLPVLPLLLRHSGRGNDFGACGGPAGPPAPARSRRREISQVIHSQACRTANSSDYSELRVQLTQPPHREKAGDGT